VLLNEQQQLNSTLSACAEHESALVCRCLFITTQQQCGASASGCGQQVITRRQHAAVWLMHPPACLLLLLLQALALRHCSHPLRQAWWTS
jgi:hypothetical protein